MTVTTGRSTHRRGRREWAQIFVGGFTLWLTCLVVTLLTANANLVPTLILLGSFLVPVTFVAWSFERWRDAHLTAELTVKAFVVGAVATPLSARAATAAAESGLTGGLTAHVRRGP